MRFLKKVSIEDLFPQSTQKEPFKTEMDRGLANEPVQRKEVPACGDLIPEEEIPAYYVEFLPDGDCVRVNYLADQVLSKGSERKGRLNFILTAKSRHILKKENGDKIPIAFLNQTDTASAPEMVPEHVYAGVNCNGKE